MPPYIEIDEGDRFGRLTVTEPDAGRNRHHKRLVRVRCDCGTVKVLALNHLRSGVITSCGCWRQEVGGRPENLAVLAAGRALWSEEGSRDATTGRWLRMGEAPADSEDVPVLRLGLPGLELTEWAGR